MCLLYSYVISQYSSILSIPEPQRLLLEASAGTFLLMNQGLKTRQKFDYSIHYLLNLLFRLSECIFCPAKDEPKDNNVHVLVRLSIQQNITSRLS